MIGNPPYQRETSYTSRQATPVYNIFVEQAMALDPHYISMITPSRWFAGGMGLDAFREMMMQCPAISMIFDYVNGKDCFPQISISGGVSYFLYDKNNKSDCRFTSIMNGQTDMETRKLNEFPVLVRYNKAVDIIRKVSAMHEIGIETIVSSLMPFGLSTNIRGTDVPTSDDYLILNSSEGQSYIDASKITKGIEYVGKYKVLMSKTSAEHAGEPGRDGRFKVFTSSMRVIGPKEVCTHSYFLIGSFDSEQKAINTMTYLKTNLFRFLVLLSLSAINLSKLVFNFVPLQDFSKPWTDSELYAKYHLTDEEIAFIEATIKPME